MSRTYSEPFLIKLFKANPHKPGVALAMACVKANLPAKYVADALDVSRMTVFNWFNGNQIRERNILKIETLTDIIESDTAKEILPARSVSEAKLYLERVVGRELNGNK
jgi:hypothetical protein